MTRLPLYMPCQGGQIYLMRSFGKREFVGLIKNHTKENWIFWYPLESLDLGDFFCQFFFLSNFLGD